MCFVETTIPKKEFEMKRLMKWFGKVKDSLGDWVYDWGDIIFPACIITLFVGVFFLVFLIADILWAYMVAWMLPGKAYVWLENQVDWAVAIMLVRLLVLLPAEYLALRSIFRDNDSLAFLAITSAFATFVAWLTMLWGFADPLTTKIIFAPFEFNFMLVFGGNTLIDRFTLRKRRRRL